MIRRLALAVCGILILAGPVAAQKTDDFGRMRDTLLTLWERGDAGSLVKLGARTGVELDVRGQSMGPLTGRRAAAALRHLFGAQETVSVRSSQASRIAGVENRAFVELTWVVRATGAPVTESSTVFIGFIREGTQWKVTQIRILP